MQKSWSYIKDSGDFIEKIKKIDNMPEDAILVTADVVELYPSIPHELGLKALEVALEKRESIQISTSRPVKMGKFVLQNNYFEFNGETKQHISGTAIGTKFAPPSACIFANQAESEILKTQIQRPLVRLRYKDDIFFIWIYGPRFTGKTNYNNFSLILTNFILPLNLRISLVENMSHF